MKIKERIAMLKDKKILRYIVTIVQSNGFVLKYSLTVAEFNGVKEWFDNAHGSSIYKLKTETDTYNIDYANILKFSYLPMTKIMEINLSVIAVNNAKISKSFRAINYLVITAVLSVLTMAVLTAYEVLTKGISIDGASILNCVKGFNVSHGIRIMIGIVFLLYYAGIMLIGYLRNKDDRELSIITFKKAENSVESYSSTILSFILVLFLMAIK